MEIKELIKQNSYTIATVVAYVAALFFLHFGVGMGCYHVTQHPAFLTDCEFFMELLPQPGGLGAYLSLFVEQYFYMSFSGAFLLVVEIALSAWLMVAFMEKFFDTKCRAKSLSWIVPLFVSVACCNNVYFDFSTITRLVLMLVFVNLLHLLPWGYKLFSAFSVVVAIVVYHCCGPLYLYSFCVAELVLYILNKIKFLDVVWTLVTTSFYPVLMYRFVMPLTPAQIFYLPSVSRSILEPFQPMIAMFYLLVPVSILVHNLACNKTFRRPAMCYVVFWTVLTCIIIGIYRMYDSRRERFSARMAWETELGNWQNVIENATKFPGYDRNTNFYYDLAVAIVGQMSSKLFEYPQLIGNEALTIEEPIAGSVCYPSSTMYFHIGQITESLHYAYESAIYYRYSPYVLRRIVDCLIILGRNDEAEVFLKQLERNMLAHKFVRDRRNFIEGKDVRSLPKGYVQLKHKLIIKHDYVMSPPYRNFEELFLANKDNYAATDYLLCYCLLAKDLENFFNVLEISNYDRKHLPKHYQEAVAMYKVTVQNPRKYATEVTIDPSISRRFVEFANVCNRDGKHAYKTVKQSFADTYWIYYTFENPMARNFSLKNSYKE